jgi:hypothetical protein
MLRHLGDVTGLSRRLRKVALAGGAIAVLGLASALSPAAATPAAAQGYGNYQCSIAFTCRTSPYYDYTDQAVYNYPAGYGSTRYLFPNYASPTYYYYPSGTSYAPYYYGYNSPYSYSYPYYSSYSSYPYYSSYSPYSAYGYPYPSYGYGYRSGYSYP